VKLVNATRTLGQKVWYPTAVNGPILLRISKGGVERFATVVMARNKERRQTNTKQGYKDSLFTSKQTVSD
jgi:hypothetical protein